ncbi:MAG: hypothetical protein H7A45_10020 [Verrucomicrobiales bacterium]|nr:hypothetical protein [Verrucomicrobiales bacterium]MCP5528608.1 hypothetical protein [Verrucomicrobiales bacterium]
MRTVTLTIELLSWWHAGSGLGRGGDADALVIRDRQGLPYLPGRTVKGLLRDALRLLEDHQEAHEAALKGATDLWFGEEDKTTPRRDGEHDYHERPGRKPGELRFSNAALTDELHQWLAAEGNDAFRQALFDRVTSTALNDAGVVKDKTLRTVEVCPPLQLTATVSGPDDGAWPELLKRCAPLVRALGSHRHRGLGRCRIEVGKASTTGGEPAPDALPAEALAKGCVWLEVKLLEDVILSARAATTGGHDCLDYLPGSVLLGAAAGRLFKEPGFGPEVFLSGKVRFGDGLPVASDDHLAWPVPLSFHFIKQEGPEGKPISGLTDTRLAAEKRARDKHQAQQFRTGHVTPDGRRIELEGDYLLKTRLDREKFGRPRDRQLFEYETLHAGARFLASIEWDENDPALAAQVARIVQSLTTPGVRLGRSRSGQFGAVEITLAKAPPEFPSSADHGVPAPEVDAPKHPLHFYLASDLALAGAEGTRLTPRAGDFGLDEKTWHFVPDRSFLRTRRYSPWNTFHAARLTERQVLVRGSVLTFARNDDGEPSPEEIAAVRAVLRARVGDHCEEGLGWVVLNPGFVLDPPELSKPDRQRTGTSAAKDAPANADPILVGWVRRRTEDAGVQEAALVLAARWADSWTKVTRKAAAGERGDRSGKSQWNEVRQRALRAGGQADALITELTGFCANGLRKRFWTHEAAGTSPWAELKRALESDASTLQAQGIDVGDLPAGQVVCTAVGLAAEIVVLRLQASKGRDMEERGRQRPDTGPDEGGRT